MKQKDYLNKPSALLATDKFLHFPAAGDQTYGDDFQKLIDDIISALFAKINGDLTEDFNANNLTSAGTVTATGLDVTGDGHFSGSVGVGASDPLSNLSVNAASSNGNVVTNIFNTNPLGYGLLIRNANDVNYSFAISNAADTAVPIQMYGDGKATFAGTVTATDFRKNGTSQTKGVAANVNLTTSTTTNVQVGNDDNYVYTISAGITPTLNINDAGFQLGDTQEFHINGGAGLNIISTGITIYEEANSGIALVGGVVTQYAGDRTSFMVKVISATEFILF